MTETGHPAHHLPVAERRRLQRSWYFYDWANSVYWTTTAAVLFAPYLTQVAKQAACPGAPTGSRCTTPLDVLGMDILPGALAPLSTTVATIIGALLLPFVGAVADRSRHPRHLMAGLAWLGAAAALSMCLATGGNWQLLVVAQLVAVFAGGASITVYDSILVDISTPAERDRVSSRGWACGYLGGFLLLAINLAMVSRPSALGLTTPQAVRSSLATVGLWWALFTIIPWWGLRHMPVTDRATVPADGSLISASFAQLTATLRDLSGYRNTWLFLLAALFFNDGLQTVVNSASLYGHEELGFSTQQLMLTILLVQGVAFFGALLFGMLAQRIGTKRAIAVCLLIWATVALIGMGLPRGGFGPFLGLGVLIGLVLGGTQALARSLYSRLVPFGREAEYFALYQAAERGTSWFGGLMFAGVYQLTQSYRPALASLVVFFVVGLFLLTLVRVHEGILAAQRGPDGRDPQRDHPDLCNT